MRSNAGDSTCGWLNDASHSTKMNANRFITIWQFLIYQPGGVVWSWYRLESSQPSLVITQAWSVFVNKTPNIDRRIGWNVSKCTASTDNLWIAEHLRQLNALHFLNNVLRMYNGCKWAYYFINYKLFALGFTADGYPWLRAADHNRMQLVVRSQPNDSPTHQHWPTARRHILRPNQTWLHTFFTNT